MIYSVVVSGVGVVHQGETLSEAVTRYGEYVLRTKNGDVGFVRKKVTLLGGENIVMRFEWE